MERNAEENDKIFLQETFLSAMICLCGKQTRSMFAWKWITKVISSVERRRMKNIKKRSTFLLALSLFQWFYFSKTVNVTETLRRLFFFHNVRENEMKQKWYWTRRNVLPVLHEPEEDHFLARHCLNRDREETFHSCWWNGSFSSCNNYCDDLPRTGDETDFSIDARKSEKICFVPVVSLMVQRLLSSFGW